MEQGTVTTSTQEYMDLIHKATINELILNKLISYESRLDSMSNEQYEIRCKLTDLETKGK